MKKYRKQIYRITSLLCSIVLIVTMAALPAYASSDFYDSPLINYFDYSNIPVNYTLTQDNNTIEFPLTRVEYIRYVDFLIFCNESYGLSNVTLNRGTVSNDLTILPLGSGYYRCYGQFSGGSSSYTDNPSLTFSFSSNSAFVQILSFKYTNFVIMRFKEIASMGVLGTDHPAAVSMEDANTPLHFYENADYSLFTGSVYLDNWRKYDYLDVLIRVNSVGLTSLYVDIGGIKIPFEINFFDSSFGAISWVNSDYGAEEWHYTFLGEQYNVEFISIRLDLSTVNKTFSEVPVIHFNGDWTENIGSSGMISLQEVTGIYKVDNITPLSYWFTNLKDFLADLFGKDDPAALQAQQTQDQVNVEVNSQIADSIELWNSNVNVVSDGFNLGLGGATASLTWLGIYADRVFDGMGWFKNIYFLVAMVSILLLLLSKSGISHGLGKVIRKD